VVLKIDGHGYSPTVLHRILHMAAVSTSFDQAALSLQIVGELSISDRQVNKLATQMGGQLAAERDAQTAAWRDQSLPRRKTEPQTAIALAAVFTDGGRMRTREPGKGRGVHHARWRETKNAAFHRMSTQSFADDPQPELSGCFRDQAYVKKLVDGLKSLKNHGRDEELASDDEAKQDIRSPNEAASWQPKTLFRTCLSSLAPSDDFGPMMAAEADARGFYRAQKQAFLADGQAYNWTIQQRWFSDFTPIVDFVHVIEYVYEAAKAIHADPDQWWPQYVAWATALWQGRAGEVIGELNQWKSQLRPPAEDATDTAPQKIVSSTITYLSNNRTRMDYPSYRRDGLPVTSSLAESLVKQISKRVKGTEMFWDDGPSGEAILQLRATVISDGNKLADWVGKRTISPFSPRCRSGPLATSV
jgi:hypothetical protein